MPAAVVTKSEVLERLLATFRDRGYDGASLAELSAAAGLGKSSLYHYFPGGKADMAEQVLAHLDEGLERAIFGPLRSRGSPTRKLAAMLTQLSEFYEGGKRACLLERLTASVEQARFRRPLAHLFERWIDAVAALGREAGLPPTLARMRAEGLVVRIEGALVVAAGAGDPQVFARTLEALGKETLAPAPGRRGPAPRVVTAAGSTSAKSRASTR
jgi:TetR/AcrR family transcriptional regulator, lmrAB and yxaGH operons repressor